MIMTVQSFAPSRSCTTHSMAAHSPSDDIFGELRGFGGHNSSEEGFHHEQFEKMLKKLETHKKADDHDDHDHEHHHEDGEHHKEEEEEEEEHHDDEKVCLEKLWPTTNETISEETARELLINLTLSLKKELTFHCDDHDHEGEEGHEEEEEKDPSPSFFVEDLFHNIVGDAHAKEKDTFDEKTLETILEKLRKGEKGIAVCMFSKKIFFNFHGLAFESSGLQSETPTRPWGSSQPLRAPFRICESSATARLLRALWMFQTGFSWPLEKFSQPEGVTAGL